MRPCLPWSLILLLFATFSLAAQPVVAERSIVAIQLDWEVVNDGVMGGRSTSQVARGDDSLIYSGQLSLDNGGGFASIRSSTLASLSFAGAERIRLRVMGDGRAYQLRLYSRQRFRGEPVAYAGTFSTRAAQWVDAELLIGELLPRYRGRQLAMPALVAADVIGIGLLLADGQPGPFQLVVEQISLHP